MVDQPVAAIDQSLRVLPLRRRPWLLGPVARLHRDIWFDDIGLPPTSVSRLEFGLPFVFGRFLLVAVDQRKRVAGYVSAVPVAGPRQHADLPPGGYDWAVKQAFDDWRNRRRPNMLVMLSVTVAKTHQRRGLAKMLIRALLATGRSAGLVTVASPIRPIAKGRRPDLTMGEYIDLVNERGEAVDPWLRLHIAGGASVIGVCSRSMDRSGDIDTWTKALGRAPVDGETPPGFLGRLTVDRAAGAVVAHEPNVWVVYADPSTSAVPDTGSIRVQERD